MKRRKFLKKTGTLFTAAFVSGWGDKAFSSETIKKGKTAEFNTDSIGHSQVCTAKFPHWYPKFSWDTVPVYQMFGDQQILTDAQVSKIAATSDFICIEKAHGKKSLGYAELGAKHANKAFKKVKPGIKVLCYFNSAWVWPYTSYNKKFYKKDITEQHRSWLMINPETGKLHDRREIYGFDVLNPQLRNWWSETVGEFVKTSACDGLFVDQMHGYRWLREDKGDQVDKMQAQMMRMAKKAIGKENILILNNAAHIPALFEIGDGFMFEHYDLEKQFSPESIKKNWQLMKKIAQAGKISIFRLHPDIKDDPQMEAINDRESKYASTDQWARFSQKELPYYLAVYLIGAQQYSYFQWGWGWGLKTGPLVHYKELQKPLGAPLGPAKEIKDNVFTREFKHLSVKVDLNNKTSQLRYK